MIAKLKADLDAAQKAAAAHKAEDDKKAQEVKKQEEVKKEAAVQEKIKELGLCPAGLAWVKEAGGYRCTGGTHFLTNAELGIKA